MTAYSDLDTTLQGYQQGAFEYLPKPFDIDQAIELVTRGCESHSRNQTSDVTVAPDNDIIGNSASIKSLFRQMAKAAKISNHCLITGELGTGKTLVANTIHFANVKKDAVLITINVSSATISSDIDEVLKQRPNATVLLKNIDNLPTQAQGYLSQTLTDYKQNKQTTTLRVIATTAVNLFDLAQHGKFDQALYHLLNEVALSLPPLRERRSDIPLLINHYLNRFGNELNEDAKPIEAVAVAFLEQYEWPGNISQLKNMCRSLSISSDMNIGLGSLPPELFETPQVEQLLFSERSISEWEYQLGLWAMRALAAGDQNIMSDAQSKLEKKLLECALQVTKGRKHEAAKLLGWGRNTLTRKLKEFY